MVYCRFKLVRTRALSRPSAPPPEGSRRPPEDPRRDPRARLYSHPRRAATRERAAGGYCLQCVRESTLDKHLAMYVKPLVRASKKHASGCLGMSCRTTVSSDEHTGKCSRVWRRCHDRSRSGAMRWYKVGVAELLNLCSNVEIHLYQAR